MLQEVEMHDMSTLVLVGFVTIAVLVFVQVLEALRHSAMFTGGARFIVAICVTLLGMIGLMQFATPTTNAREGVRIIVIPWLLIPYVALFLALALLALLALWRRLTRTRKRNTPTESPTWTWETRIFRVPRLREYDVPTLDFKLRHSTPNDAKHLVRDGDVSKPSSDEQKEKSAKQAQREKPRQDERNITR